MLKNYFIKAYTSLKEDNNLTYKDIAEITGLTLSQISMILRNNGDSVSVEKMESGLRKAGFIAEVIFYDTKGDF